MKIALVVIGDEILSGRILDANTPWFIAFLKNEGLSLCEHRTIKDSPQSIEKCLQELCVNTDLIITTGGLGPTPDDLTKQSISNAFLLPLVNSQQAFDFAVKHYKRIDRSYSSLAKKGHRYHLIPKETAALENPEGLAPGIHLKKEHFSLCAFPGVPREFFKMIQTHWEIISKPFIKQTQHIYTCRTFGIPEENIFDELCPQLWKDLSSFGAVSSYPQTGGVDIVLTSTLANLQNKFEDIFLKTPLNKYIWQFGDQSLESLIVKKAKQKKIQIATAESCTGGLIAHTISNVSGASEVFSGSIISYSNQLKKDLLKVDDQTLKKFGAVSSEVALEMAQGALALLDTRSSPSICISTTGIAGPLGGSRDKPVGTIYIGYATSWNNSGVNFFQLKGDRLKLKQQFCNKALYQLNLLINEYSQDG